MTRQQRIEKRKRIEKQSKKLKRFLKKYGAAVRQVNFGFEPPVVNGFGQCSGCYNPDDGQMEQDCRVCQYNEYFTEGITEQWENTPMRML